MKRVTAGAKTEPPRALTLRERGPMSPTAKTLIAQRIGLVARFIYVEGPVGFYTFMVGPDVDRFEQFTGCTCVWYWTGHYYSLIGYLDGSKISENWIHDDVFETVAIFVTTNRAAEYKLIEAQSSSGCEQDQKNALRVRGHHIQSQLAQNKKDK
jgi:hypothetical protein